jgi:hypothetical protein
MKIKNISTELVKRLKRSKGFTFGGTLEDYIRAHFGPKASSAGRVLRKLSAKEEGKEPIIIKSYEVVGNPGRRVVKYRYNDK